jgi:hypothetical protein
MPYFVFKVRGDKSSMTLLQRFDVFKEASQFAKTQRKDLPTGDPYYIKLVHAEDELEGERLIREPRQPSSPVEEWEV